MLTVTDKYRLFDATRIQIMTTAYTEKENSKMLLKKFNLNLYLVTDRRWLGGRTFETCIEAAIRGGGTLVQLREKNLGSGDFFKMAQTVKAVTDRCNIPLIINDRLDIALAVDAAGVHLGLEDLPVVVARKLLGPDKIVGASAATVDEAILFQNQGADYLGVGAVFPTTTKLGNEAVSLDDLQTITAAVHIPVVAIGGINTENAASVLATGVAGIAVVSAIMNQSDIEAAAMRLTTMRKGAVV